MLSTDPVDILLDEDNNFTFINGVLQFSRGLQAVRQGQRLRLLAVRGEWFMDLDDGVPWMERDGVPKNIAILGQKFNRSRLLNEARKALFATPGTTSILQLIANFESKSRVATLQYQTRTIFGDTPLDTLTRTI